MVNFKPKDSYSFEDLVEIMRLLRSENGCPWDREQTHESIRRNFIEEAYEAVEAIDKKDDANLCEELGDVLLQVVFHARIAEEDSRFDIGDVADGICKKLVLRHPHIFGDVSANTSEEVLRNWDEIKKAFPEGFGASVVTPPQDPTNPPKPISPTDPKGGIKLTKEAIEKMSPEEVNKNWDAVQEFLKSQ